MAAIQTSLVIFFLLGQTCVQAAVFKQGQNAFLLTNSTAAPLISFAHMMTNNTVVNSMRLEVEYELHMNGDAPVKNKVIYVLLAMLLGGLGVDRCFMGQILAGCLKAVTGGGCGVWSLVDYVIAAHSGLTMAEDINAFMYKATFEKGSVESAYYTAAIIIGLQFLPIVLYSCLLCCMVGIFGAAAGLQGKEIHEDISQKTVSATNITKAYTPAPIIKAARNYGLVSDVPTAQEIDALFDNMDADRDGSIDQSELKKAMETRGYLTTDADEMMKKADTSKDGKISRDELKAFLMPKADAVAAA
jgi:TM2 domain-containing membrane protein YozV